MELKENNCGTKGKQMWNALFLMIQFVSNRKKNEKEMEEGKATEGKGYLTIKSRRPPKANIGTLG